MPPVDDNADLLLRIQSDVAQGVQGLQEVGGQLGNLLNVAVDTNKVLRDMNASAYAAERGLGGVMRQADAAGGGFGRFARAVITGNQALGLAHQAYSISAGLLDKLVLSTLREADALDKLSTRTGVSSSTLSSYGLALRQANTDVSTLAHAIELFERKLQSADKGGGGCGRFGEKNFGQSAQSLLKDPDKLVDRIAEVMQRSTAQQRSTVSGAIFGPRARELTPFFALGAENIRKTQAEMRDLGGIMGRDFVRAAAKANDEIARLEETFRGLRIEVATKFFPVFNENLQKLLAWLRGHQGELSEGVVKWLDQAAEALKRVAPLAENLASSMAKVASVGLDPHSALGQVIAFASNHPLIAAAMFSGNPRLMAGAVAIDSYVNREQYRDAAIDAMHALSPTDGLTPGQRIRRVEDRFVRGPLGMRPLRRSPLERSAPAAGRSGSISFLHPASAGTAAYPGTESFLGMVDVLGGLSPGGAGGGVDTTDLTNTPGAAAAVDNAQIQAALAVKNALIDVEETKWKALLDLKQIQQVEFLKREREFALERIAIQEDAAKKELAAAQRAGDTGGVTTAQGQLDVLGVQRQGVNADFGGRIAVAERDHADQLRQTLFDVNQLSDRAFGNDRQSQIRQLGNEWQQMVDKLRRSGMEEYIGQVDAAYGKLLTDADSITVNIGQTIRQGIGDAFSGVVLGTRDPSDLLQGFTQALEAQWADVFGSMLEEKLDFDVQLKKNFLEDIPEFAADGADKVGGVFSGLWNWLSGTSKRESPNIDPNSGTASGIFGGNSPLDLAQRFFGGSGAQRAPGSTSSFSVGRGGGYATRVVGQSGGAVTVENEFDQRFSGSDLDATQQAASGVSAPTGDGGASGLALAAATYGVGLALDLIFNGPGRQDKLFAGTDTLRTKLSQGDILYAFGGGGIVGGLGRLMAETDPITKAFLDVTNIFQAPTAGTQRKMGLEKLFGARRLPQQRDYNIGGHSGIRTQFLESAVDTSTLGEFADVGFGANIPGLAGSRQTLEVLGSEFVVDRDGNLTRRRREHKVGAAGKLQRDLATRREQSPEVEAQRTREALGLGVILTGNLPGGVNVANTLTNNLLLLGVSAKEAKRQLRALADQAGVTLPNAVEEAQRLYSEGKFKDDPTTAVNEKSQQLFTTIDGITALYRDDLPAAIDVSALAMANFTEQAGVDIAEFNADLERAIKVFAGFDLKTSVVSGVTAPAGQGAQAFRTSIKQNYQQTVVDQMTTAISQNDTLEALFAVPTAKIADAFQLLEAGDYAGADKLLKEAGDSMKAAYEEGGKLIDQFLAASPEFKKIIDDMQAAAQATDALRAGLDAAFAPLLNPNLDLEQQARERRIESLKHSIDLAHQFGDELKAAELEMALGSEEAAQRLEGTAGGADRFARAVKQKIKEQVVLGFIEGVLASQAVQQAMQPFLLELNKVVAGIVADPSQADALIGGLAGAMTTFMAALQPVVAAIELIAPTLSQLQFADGGIVPGPLGMPRIVTAHAGEVILNRAQQANVVAHGADGGIQVYVNVSGNTLMNSADIDRLALRTGEAMMDQLKRQQPIVHRR